jgi:DNA-binding transcriptional ArsR family regulator
MTAELDPSETTLVQRLVLLGVVGLDGAGETPAHTLDVIHACDDHVDVVDADVLGDLTETEVSRALNALEAGGLVAKVAVEDRSVVGKGRPTYGLAADREAVLSVLADDDRVAGVVDRVRREAT